MRSARVTPVVLVAHGSTDPRAAAAIRSLARAVGRLRTGLDVRVSYLDHAGPRPDEALAAVRREGHRRAFVVPILLTAAYHGRVDLPGVLVRARAASRGLEITMTEVLGPVDGAVHPLLVRALCRRLRAAQPNGFDGVALLAAGTRDVPARSTVELAAATLGARLGLPAAAGYAAASPITGEAAVESLRALGCRRIAVSSYFLAPGRLHDAAVASALAAGGQRPAAAALGPAVDIARLVLYRLAGVRAGAQQDAPANRSGAML